MKDVFAALFAKLAASPTAYCDKWLLTEETGRARLVRSVDSDFSAILVALDSTTRILPEYTVAIETLQHDGGFDEARLRASGLIDLNDLLRRVFIESCCTDGHRIYFDADRAVIFLDNARSCLTGASVSYSFSARVLGVAMEVNDIIIGDGVHLVRLSIDEINARQPSSSAPTFPDADPCELLQHGAELRLDLDIPYDKNRDFFQTAVAADKQAQLRLGAALAALRLVLPGLLELGQIRQRGVLWSTASGRIFSLRVPPGSVILDNEAAIRIPVAYHLFTHAIDNDRVLSAAIHRFLLGKSRTEPLDKLVDFVIALEALLLTVNGSGARDELSYRFTVNGTSLLSVVLRRYAADDAHIRLKTAYTVRSAIVHGASRETTEDACKKAFSGSTELVAFLEDTLRSIIFWLHDVPLHRRPYIQPGGWEALLWRTSETH